MSQPPSSTQNRLVGDLRQTIPFLVSVRGMSVGEAFEYMHVPLADRSSILCFFDTKRPEADIRLADNGGKQIWTLDPEAVVRGK